ncbi:hypothetical protein MNBD_GAMMA18-1753 [hydrothermal vent metagenome]|uniref:RES domain-containing protein n=1 Tax=hydrothermal vent metagenome TaxID=652676 RepID=A0A3B0ZPD4_9ZZZZ
MITTPVLVHQPPYIDVLAYRIGDVRFPIFDGRGAMLQGGRWNSPGHPVIYASLSQAGAMLEVLTHANIGKLPRFSQMVIIEIPDTLSIETVEPSNLAGWDHLNMKASRHFADEWITSQRSVALIVPSVIAPCDHNIVINQMHPDFLKITHHEPEPIIWDKRLFAK